MPDNRDPNEPLDIRFRRPESYVVSVRLNAEESAVLTEAADEADEKLSTFIKAAAIAMVEQRRRERSQANAFVSSEGVSFHAVFGTHVVGYDRTMGSPTADLVQTAG